MAKWCQIGLQGALLSLFLEEPIFFKTITIIGNTPYSEAALLRALFCRINKEPTVSLGQANLSFQFQKTENKQPSPSSIIWYLSTSK